MATTIEHITLPDLARINERKIDNLQYTFLFQQYVNYIRIKIFIKQIGN